jgi:transcriptional regulator with XRE-family HTH domain
MATRPVPIDERTQVRASRRPPGDPVLGAFLRAQRQHVDPAAVGITVTGRRRASGLRREEVATLSGVGLSWYTWLEQGRVAASRGVLVAICRALRIEGHAYRHVMELAGFHAGAAPTASGSVEADARALVDGWSGGPAAYVDGVLDLRAWNEAYARWWGDPADLPPDQRNLLWQLLVHPGTRDRLADPTFPRMLVARLRGHADRHPDDPGIGSVRDRLAAARPDLGDWFACRDVAEPATVRLDLRHPEGRSATFVLHPLVPAADPAALFLAMQLETPGVAEQQPMDYERSS